MLVFTRSTPVRNRLSERQQSHGWLNPAGRDSAGCNSILMTVGVSYSSVSHISSLMLASYEFSGFMKFRKPFRDCNRLIADMWFYRWCFAYAAFLDLSVRLATVRMMSGGAMAANICRLSILVGFKQPVLMQQQSYRADMVKLTCMC